MSFEIDKQTLKDLELFDNNSESNSISLFFDQTQSAGGKQRLLEIMRKPSSQKKDLVERRDAIKFFINHQIDIDFSSKKLEFINYYLTLNTPILKSNIIDRYYQSISNWFRPNNNLYLIQTGIRSIIFLLQSLRNGLSKINAEEAPEKLKEDLKLIKLILNNSKISSLHLKKEPSFIDFLKADKLIRDQMKPQFNILLDIIHNFDVFQGLAKVAKTKRLCFAEYTDSLIPTFKADSLYHPFLENAVKNDVLMENNQNLMFLTGSNMAGKSTFMKSVGISIYLAHLGFPIPADKVEISIYKGLITAVNLPDNIMLGYSHFYSEVMRVKQTAQVIQEREKVFVIFDELFRGTNVKDAYDASLGVISSFSNISNCTFIVSTHITEVAKQLEKKPNIQFKYFDSTLVGDKPVYKYKLLNGISDERMGMYILRNEKVIELLDSISENQKL